MNALKKKYLKYTLLPVMALSLLVGGASIAAAHGGGFGFGGIMNIDPQELATRQQAMFQTQAILLGISVDEIKTAWAAGKDLKELAKEKGITEETLKQKLQEQHKQQMKDHLQTLVTKGVITQAQADQRLTFMEQMMQKGEKGRGGKMMMKKGRGGHMGAFGL